jgi:hypothetical protein
MTYRNIETYVSVDVDLGEFDTDDLIEELESRGKAVGSLTDNSVLVHSIYEKRRLGQDYQQELDELIYQVTGRIL